MNENEIDKIDETAGATEPTEPAGDEPAEITLGYKSEKPADAESEAELYAKIESAVNEHNKSAQPGEYYWGISFANSSYEIIQGEIVPEPVTSPEPVEPTINEIREQKLDEASDTCGKIICDGFDVELSTGKKHFSLETTDQTNIDGIFNAIILGATEYPYHADGEPCTMFSAADIMTLYVATKSYVTQQTTYCNALRQWIKREEDKDTLVAIEYGTPLPDDLAADVEQILTAAKGQVEAIVSKLTTTVAI